MKTRRNAFFISQYMILGLILEPKTNLFERFVTAGTKMLHCIDLVATGVKPHPYHVNVIGHETEDWASQTVSENRMSEEFTESVVES